MDNRHRHTDSAGAVRNRRLTGGRKGQGPKDERVHWGIGDVVPGACKLRKVIIDYTSDGWFCTPHTILVPIRAKRGDVVTFRRGYKSVDGRSVPRFEKGYVL